MKSASASLNVAILKASSSDTRHLQPAHYSYILAIIHDRNCSLAVTQIHTLKNLMDEFPRLRQLFHFPSWQWELHFQEDKRVLFITISNYLGFHFYLTFASVLLM